MPTMPHRRTLVVLLALTAIGVIACTGPGSTPSPSPPAAEEVISTAHAAAIVLASDPHFAGVGPRNPGLIGQCCWYEAVETADGYEVTVELGWGDCPAGCIDRHRWLYAVSRDGSLTLVDERGSDVDTLPPPEGGDAPARFVMRIVAGPVCPVETEPPDPNCAPRPVAGAELVIRSPDGREAVRGVSDDDGIVGLPLAGGAYYVEALPVEGLMLAPEPVAFSVLPGGELQLELAYDTGIR